MQISTFWFVVTILANLWLGGAMALAILAYVGWQNENTVTDILSGLSFWWESRGGSDSKKKRFVVTFLTWLLYPIFLILAWVGTIIEMREVEEAKRS